MISRTSEKEKKQSKRKSSNEHGKSLSLVTRALCEIGEDLISLVCLELNARALVLNAMAENLDALKCGGWGYL